MKKFIFILSIFGSIMLVIFCREHFRIVIPTGSMEPNLVVGSQYLVSKTESSDIERGDIVVFYRGDELFVKRVLGLPNDIVKIDNGVVVINGCPIEEPYLGQTDTLCAQFYVPEDALLLLGDNRKVSSDSRYWDDPYIKLDAIVGKVVISLYPRIKFLEKYYYEVF